METKTYIWIGIFIGSIVGGWLGAVFDHGDWLGMLSFVLGTVGSFVGVWVGYKISQR